MHEQLIREFVERAEAEVHLPDLAALELRGHHRRRNRQAAGAIAAVMAVAAIGIGILGWTGDPDRGAPEPSEPPPGLKLDAIVPHKQVAAGREYTIPIYGQAYSKTIPDGQLMLVRFTAVGQDWYWDYDNVFKVTPGADVEDPSSMYAEVKVSLIDRFPVVQCPKDTIRWKDGAGDVMGLAEQAAAVPIVDVLQAPSATTFAGYPAAHLRVRVTELCRQFENAVLWSVFPSSTRGTGGVGTVYHDGQVVDLWFLDVEGTHAVVSVGYTPGVPQAMREEASATAESIQLGMFDE